MTAHVISPAKAEVTWARQSVTEQQRGIAEWFARELHQRHWSRWFEYPWGLINGGFTARQWVLDAAGGDSVFQHVMAAHKCQVINVDIDPSRQPSSAAGVLTAAGDLRSLVSIQDEMFDRCVCLSVLEHIEGYQQVVPELWRVLKPGGRLLLSFDVAHYARHNHTIDMAGAKQLVGMLGLGVPAVPADVLTMSFPELDDGRPGEAQVNLITLCLWADKR